MTRTLEFAPVSLPVGELLESMHSHCLEYLYGGNKHSLAMKGKPPFWFCGEVSTHAYTVPTPSEPVHFLQGKS